MDNSAFDKSRRIQILLNDSLDSRLSKAAEQYGITKSAFVRVALEREFALDQQLALECALKVKSPGQKQKTT
ncbi:MAG: ribbon-helix-helix domain-containing protein [Anaerolineales bacterium]|nr:ribbon-helix-helix domain-containing protein [Anaerolineales bacterium]